MSRTGVQRTDAECRTFLVHALFLYSLCLSTRISHPRLPALADADGKALSRLYGTSRAALRMNEATT